MSQIPPNEHEARGHADAPAENPYARRTTTQPPDLDADGPYLRADDVQRLNRKALAFLAIIVICLAGLAAWIFSGGLSSNDEPRRQEPSQQVVIPAAPRDLPALPPERPVAQAPPVDELPPLPVIDDTPTGSMLPSMPGTDSLPGSEQLTLLQRRIQNINDSDEEGAGGDAGPYNPAAAAADPGQGRPEGLADGPTSAQPLYKPNTLLLRGTYIRCILQSRVISDFPGYTSCIVTEPVYSVDGKRLLLPRGSKVQGSYGAGDLLGDRVAIVWDRITTPTGLDINMRSPGVDMLGSAGNPGYYNAHWGQRIASSLLISILADAFKYAAAENGPETSTYVNGAVVQNPYESATARNMERMANLAMERNMTRPATVTINQGTIVNVYVARDVDFSAVMR